MLGEDQHADLGVGALDLGRGPRPLVGVTRWHANVEDDEIWTVFGDRDDQSLGISERCDDVVSGVGEEPPESLAEEHLVLDDHDSHGSSAVSVVPAP